MNLMKLSPSLVALQKEAKRQQQIYRSVQYINCCFREGSEALGVIAHVTLAYADTIKMWWQRL